MDRRSWLWRRKSSEKSPNGETESSGSVSSHSERFSDDQTPSNHNIQSPEVTSKAAPEHELDDSVKTLSEKFSEAILNIGAKEDLIKQHAKVAEEAVSGWEKAENELSVLKKQNDALTQKNTILEERVGHLDGALKECLRQLRQAREDQHEKIYEISELHSQLQNAKSDANVIAGARSKLEAAEKENALLKLKLLSKDEELEHKIRERDLSTYTAETASKQHLDSIKKVTKLEAECRRLKALVRKATVTNDHQSVTTSSIYVESFSDSQSDIGERILFMENDNEPFYPHSRGFALRKDLEQIKDGRKSLIAPPVEIDLMDDFLEMERIIALPEMHNGSGPDSRIDGEESLLRNELDVTIKHVAELEDSLRKTTAEKLSLGVALCECQNKLMASENQLKQTEVTLVDLKEKLVCADEAKKDADKQVEHSNSELKNLTELLEAANLRNAESESKLKGMELQTKTLRSSISALEKERIHAGEADAKCDKLEAKIYKSKSYSRLQRSASNEEFRINQDKELAAAATKFSECQKTIASLGRQLKSLATLEDFLMDCETPIPVL